jgi:hypothetical protein
VAIVLAQDLEIAFRTEIPLLQLEMILGTKKGLVAISILLRLDEI